MPSKAASSGFAGADFGQIGTIGEEEGLDGPSSAILDGGLNVGLDGVSVQTWAIIASWIVTVTSASSSVIRAEPSSAIIMVKVKAAS